VQVDPIKPTLKAPGTNLLTLKCDEPLSTFAFNFNLRRYIVEHLFRTYGPKGFELPGMREQAQGGGEAGAGRGLHSFTFQLKPQSREKNRQSFA